MAKKLLETNLGHWDDTWFSLDGKRVPDKNALDLIKHKCNPYNTKDDGGIIVYFSEREYKELKKKHDIEE